MNAIRDMLKKQIADARAQATVKSLMTWTGVLRRFALSFASRVV